MGRITTFIASLVLIAIPLTADASRAERKLPDMEDVATALELFRDADPGMSRFFNSAYAYVIFPEVKKGGIGIGGAYGKGAVYRGGDLVGSATVRQATIGLQLGGQVYAEVIFFEDRAAFEAFTQGDYELSAQASAVAAAEGVAATAAYEHGVSIFTVAVGGLMYEASVGGQKFNYWEL